jgi:hypothetical protein
MIEFPEALYNAVRLEKEQCNGILSNLLQDIGVSDLSRLKGSVCCVMSRTHESLQNAMSALGADTV